MDTSAKYRPPLIPFQPHCRLEECLAEYTKLEMLTDCICRKCSMIATHQRLQQDADRLERSVHTDPQTTISKKRKAKDTRKLEVKVKAALQHGRLEEDIRGLKLEKVFSKTSTKQAMIARVHHSSPFHPTVSDLPI